MSLQPADPTVDQPATSTDDTYEDALFEQCREVSGVLGFGWPTLPAARRPLDDEVTETQDVVLVDLVVDLTDQPRGPLDLELAAGVIDGWGEYGS